MSKPFFPPDLQRKPIDPEPAEAARLRAFQQAQDSCVQRGGTAGRLKRFPGNH